MSSETKFTKGKWYCVFGNTYSCVRVHGRVVADLRTVNNVYNKSDAHLIAAAPEMYEMLESLREDYGLLTTVGKDIDKLLAKARGEKNAKS